MEDLCTLKSNLCQVILEVVSEDGAKSKCCFEGMYPLEVELGLGLGLGDHNSCLNFARHYAVDHVFVTFLEASTIALATAK